MHQLHISTGSSQIYRCLVLTRFFNTQTKDTSPQHSLTFPSQTQMAAATLSVRPNRLSPGSQIPRPPAVHHLNPTCHPTPLKPTKSELFRGLTSLSRRTLAASGVAKAGSRADDSAPFEMSVENALKLLGVSETASFDEILRAKNSIVANCKDDQEAIAQVTFISHPY